MPSGSRKIHFLDISLRERHDCVVDDDGMTWAGWLRDRLDERGWKQADLVKNSAGHIKRDRVSKWLSGAESPNHRNALIVANTLGAPHADALQAAGFHAYVSSISTELEHLNINVDPTLMVRSIPETVILAELLRRATERERKNGVD